MKKILHPADILLPTIGKLLDKHGKVPELPLSFLPGMNKKIWGLKKGKLVVVGGRTSQGKSVFLLQSAYSLVKAGKKVVFISLEMTLEVCVLRIMNAECDIDNWCNIAGMSEADYAMYKQKITKFHKELDETNFVFVEGYGGTFDEIFNILEGLGVDVDAVFIDYVQMTSQPGKNDKHAIDEYIKKLRNYAIKKNFCAVIGSQINRGTHDGHKVRKPEMWELKSSGALEEICDMCILVHWQYHYTRETEIYNDYWIRVAKNRDGRTGVFDCQYEPKYYKITEDLHGKNTTNEPTEGFAPRGAYIN